MAKKSLIIWGPGGCGKSTHSQMLADYFGLRNIFDGADIRHDELPIEDALILTSVEPNRKNARFDIASLFNVMTFADAMSIATGKAS